MKLRINSIGLLAYLALVSIILKEILYIPIFIAVLAVFLRSYIPNELENMLYLLIALSPFLPVLAIFAFYLPLAVYGIFLGDSGFIKKYLFGYAASFFSVIFVYTLSLLGIGISLPVLISAFYIPAMAVAFKIYRKNRTFASFREIYRIEPKEFMVLLVSLFFLFFVAHGILNNSSLYMSNGTYVYTKFLSVVEGVNKFGQVPQYEPRIAEGEQLFYTDTPVFYSSLAFVSLILGWIAHVLFFNSATVFIIWLSILGLWLFLREMIPGEKNGYIHFIAPAAASLSVILSFMFLQLFESFKQSSTYPINFLILGLIFSNARNFRILASIAALLLISFLIHGTHFIGFVQIAAFSFILLFLMDKPLEHLKMAFEYFKKNKLAITAVFILLLLVPLFYLMPGHLFKSYMREPYSLKTELSFPQMKAVVSNYLFSSLFLDKNTNPLSVSYPDLHRIDDKRFGFFFTFFGIACFLIAIFSFRKNAFRKTAAFSLAYLLHFLFSSFLVTITFFSSIEYGYRTVLPFMLVVFLASIAALICSIQSRTAKIALLVILFGAFLHASFYVKENLNNIHSESIIAGQTFKNEINFAKQLPADGRIITYGMYSNAVDMAMAYLADRPFSRYGFLQWDFGDDNLYMKVHGLNSFGEADMLNSFSGYELVNYLRLGGYKYVFLNACTQPGLAALNKLLSNNESYPIYQNPNYRCNVFLGVNGTHYAEKVDAVKNVGNEAYKKPDGYKYITFSRNAKVHNFNLDGYLEDTAETPSSPKPLDFERQSPTQADIFGDFKSNDWVVFKEEYFPRWKAYMGSKEIPLLATNHRMMLMKTADGNKISLVYSLLPAEKFAALLSLIAVALLILIFVFAV